MYDMEIMMGYSAVQRRQNMTYGSPERISQKASKKSGDTAKSLQQKTQKNSGNTVKNVQQKDAKEVAVAKEFSEEEKAAERSSDGNDAEVRFEVSGRAAQVASQIWSYYVMEQEENLKNTGSEKETEKTEKKGKKEETPFQKQLREKLEEARSLDTMFRRMRELNEQAKKKNSQKKKVNYSYHRVSAAISGAKTATQASLALSSASSNVSALKRKAASGQYEKKEIDAAIGHAEKMVRIARKKVQNIKWEIQQKKRNQSREERKKQQNADIRSIPKKAKAEKELFRLKEQLKAQEKSRKHKNRREEDMGLLSADMQYLQKKIDLLKQETSSVSAVGGTITVSGELTAEMTDTAGSTGSAQTAGVAGSTQVATGTSERAVSEGLR